jgi:hypothetical protein
MKRAVLLATLAAVLVVGGAASLRSTTGSTMRFFIRDSAQSNADLGDKGPSQGDQFFYHGTTFTRPGGVAIGRYAGSCTTYSGTPGVPEDSDCTLFYIFPKGSIMTRLLGAKDDVFGGKPVPFAVLGGTGVYRTARGEGTIVVPTDVPNQTDASIVLRLR